jgi:hypothetical protein
MITTTNSQHYRFGNRINGKAVYFFQKSYSKVSLFPSVGINIENGSRDNFYNERQNNSGGTILFSHAGVEFSFRKLALNFEFELPVKQELYGSQPQLKYRIISGLTYTFN